MTDRTPTLEELTKLLKAFVDTTSKAMDAVARQQAITARPYENIAKAMTEQLEQSNEQRIPGRRAYNAFKEYRKDLHTPTQWDDPRWTQKWGETYKARARAGVLNPYQTMILSVLTDETMNASEMRNLIAVLALLPPEKVLPFYNFSMFEKMGIESAEAVEHMDTIPVPMHNPLILADLNSKTLQEYVAWKNTPVYYEGYGAPQQPFSLYAEDAAFNGKYRGTGTFDRTQQTQQTPQRPQRDLIGSGVADVPLIKSTRLTVFGPGTEPKNGSRANNQKLALEKSA